MSEQFLNGSNVVPVLEQLRRDKRRGGNPATSG